MTEFFQTMMGRKFYDGDVPRIAKALEKIGDELKRANDLKEKESTVWIDSKQKHGPSND